MDNEKILYFGGKATRGLLLGLLKQKGYLATVVTTVFIFIGLYALVATIPFTGFMDFIFFKSLFLVLTLVFILQYLSILVEARIGRDVLVLRRLKKHHLFHWEQIRRIKLLEAPSTGVYYGFLKSKGKFWPYIFVIFAPTHEPERVKTLEEFIDLMSEKTNLSRSRKLESTKQ